jgi:hypothetical protein
MQAAVSPSRHPKAITTLFILVLLEKLVDSWFAVLLIDPVSSSRRARDSLSTLLKLYAISSLV